MGNEEDQVASNKALEARVVELEAKVKKLEEDATKDIDPSRLMSGLTSIMRRLAQGG